MLILGAISGTKEFVFAVSDCGSRNDGKPLT